MKTTQLISAIILVLLFSSCSTTHMLTIKGTPGNVISEKAVIDNDAIGVIDNTGNIKIELKRKSPYKSFLFSINPNTQIATPFALDFHKNNTDGVMVSTALGGTALLYLSAAMESIPLMDISCILEMGGLLGILFSGDDVHNGYSYDTYQTTNDDLVGK